MRKSRSFNLLLISVLFLGACNLPSNNNEDAVGTAAAQTLAVVLSATPIGGVITPTFTQLSTPVTLTPIPGPVSTNTAVATATSNCNNMQFITDVTIPDGTILSPSQAFTKIWRIKNVGTCSWTPSYAIVFSSGNSMSGPATQALTGNVNPGETLDVSVNLISPASPGDYTSYWKLRDGSGVLFDQFYVQIKVQNPVIATNTLPPAIVFAVTSVNYVVNTWNAPGFVNCPKITANITTNGAGTVDYHWTRSDGSETSGSLVFGSAGSQAISKEWSLGSVWAPAPDEWIGIYIDTPNHQDFGHATMPPCTSP